MTKHLPTAQENLSAQDSAKEGLLLLNKARGSTSFSLVTQLRKRSGIRKIGHGGTLDPLASGVMVFLIGRSFTKQADLFLHDDKGYLATIKLGETTTTFDSEGKITQTSSRVPTLQEVEEVIGHFQGSCQQIPPMFSAKKIAGQKLYHLARRGLEVERKPITVTLTTTLCSYAYPYVTTQIVCSKGTYIRSFAQEMGIQLATGAHLTALERTHSGCFTLKDCIDAKQLYDPSFSYVPYLRRQL